MSEPLERVDVWDVVGFAFAFGGLAAFYVALSIVILWYGESL